MARGKIVDSELYAKILAAFQASGPGKITAVSRATGISSETISRAWKLGWPDRNLSPIKDLDIWSHSVMTIRDDTDSATYGNVSSDSATYRHGHIEQEAGPSPASATDRVETVDPAPRQNNEDAPSQPSKTSQAIAVIAADEMPAWLMDERETLRVARSLAKGAVASSLNLLAGLQADINALGEELKWNRETGAKNSRPASTIKYVGKVMAIAQKAIAMHKALMEEQRLHEDKPQSISEQRSYADEGEGAHLAQLIRHAFHEARPVRVIDVAATPYRGEESGSEVGKDPG